MTTICYRDGILAGDSAWCDGDGFASSHTKLLRLKHGALYGACGAADDRQLVDLLQRYMKPEELPYFDVLRTMPDGKALVIWPRGDVWQIDTGDEDHGAWQVHAPFAAIGSGAKYARGAMAAGVTADSAVRIACDLDIHTREPVTMLRLGEGV